MKCEGCGNNLNIEQKFCPYCGRPNPFAIKHQKDMEQYEKEFTETKQGVERATASFTGMIARITVVLLLVVLTIFFTYMKNQGVYSLNHARKEADLEKNGKKYAEVMDDLEKNDQWKKMVDYFYAHDLSYSDDLSHYSRVVNAAYSYWDIFYDLRQCEESDYQNELSYSAQSISNSLDDAYSTIYRTDYKGEYNDRYYTDTHKNSMKRILSDMNAVLKTYAGFSDEELKQLPDMSDAKKQVTIEEHLEKLYGDRSEDSSDEK